MGQTTDAAHDKTAVHGGDRAKEMTREMARGVAPLDPSRVSAVAALKRLFEFWGFDREFHDAYLADPASVLAASGLDVDPRAASLVLLRRLPEGDDGDLPKTFEWYRDFVDGRFVRGRNELRRQVHEDPRLRDWRDRQVLRCRREMPDLAHFMLHLPVVFELSLGCSVGCPFCALSAGRLQKVFRHTEDNAALWRDVLARLHALMGDVAGTGACYYATEPLDNPDYELFLADYYDEFGCVPQTTTAAATRDLNRTRELLRWGQMTYLHFDRLSLLSKEEGDLIHAAFTAEELLYTDLIPQFPDSPICSLKKAGRNIRSEQGVSGTVACASGFIVNMAERSVRLVTPTIADEEHPTGEIEYEKASFTDGASLEEVVCAMIDRHMHQTISLATLFG